MNSAIYTGEVYHRRFSGHAHAFRYRSVYFLLDLDELDELARISKWFSVNDRGWFAYRDRDHGDGSDEPLSNWLGRILGEAGYAAAGWRFRVLTMPRMLGYVFNPISVIFCDHAASGDATMIYEVNNTFGERVAYLAPRPANTTSIRQRCDKSIFVSPFFELAGYYDFAIDNAEDFLRVGIDYHVGDERCLHASFTGQRIAFDRASLQRIALTQSATTVKVTAAIHFQALRLWLRGNRLTLRKPAAKSPSIGINNL